MLLQLFLQHTELPTQRAGSISLLVGCYLARGLSPQAKSFVTLGFSTAMSWESAAAPADRCHWHRKFPSADAWWEGAAGGTWPENQKGQRRHDCVERNCEELHLQVFGKGAYCCRPLCGKGNKSLWANKWIHNETQGEWRGDVMLSTRAFSIACGNQDSYSDTIHKRSLQEVPSPGQMSMTSIKN